MEMGGVAVSDFGSRCLQRQSPGAGFRLGQLSFSDAEYLQIILDQQTFLDHLVKVRVVIRVVKTDKGQTLPWNVLSLSRRSRSPNSGTMSDIFELFPADKLFWFRHIGDEKTDSDLRS